MGGNEKMSEEESFENLGMILSSPPKRRIMMLLSLEDRRFTDLLDALETTSGNLNYHLLRLRSAGLLSKRQQRYRLTTSGRKIAEKIKELR